VVGVEDMTLNVATRYNQVVSHFITPTGIDKKTSNSYKTDNRTLQWIAAFDENDYYLTRTALHHRREIIREAEADQIFLRVDKGSSQAGNLLFLIYKNTVHNIYCVESYLNSFLNKYCIEKPSEDLLEFQFYEDHLVIGFSNSTLLLTSSL
jgi:hypothetical protein